MDIFDILASVCTKNDATQILLQHLKMTHKHLSILHILPTPTHSQNLLPADTGVTDPMSHYYQLATYSMDDSGFLWTSKVVKTHL